jgi:DNA-binding CsgD family transcriptional regulator
MAAASQGGSGTASISACGSGHDQAGLDQAILRVGDRAFPDALMGHLRRIAAVDHCMVFAFKPDNTAQCLLTAGNIAIGPDLGAAYAGHFHASDPNKEAIFRCDGAGDPILMPFMARRMYRQDYRKLFFDDSGIVDKFAAAVWHDGVCVYTNFYRIEASGSYSAAQLAALNRVSPVVTAAVAKHFELARLAAPAAGDASAVLRHVFDLAPLNTLTTRERDVCSRILHGFSSEAIASELAISLNSVLTYRRRAYQRLGITSQNELFAIVMMLTSGRRDLPDLPASPVRSLN